jgi:hypothetical protein
MRRHGAAFQSCYEWDGLVDDPGLETTLVVSFELVERSMEPVQVTVTADRRAPPAMVRCVLRVASSMRWHRSTDTRCDPRPVRINYPLYFRRRVEDRPGRSSTSR